MKLKEWHTKGHEIAQFLDKWVNRYYLLDCTNNWRKKVVKKNELAFADIVGSVKIEPIFNSSKTLCYMRWYVLVDDPSVLNNDFDPKSIDRQEWFGDIEKNDILRTMHLSK